MKKWLLSGSLLLVILLVIMTVATGRVFEQQLEKAVAQVASSPGYTLVSQDIRGGLLGSEADLELAFQLDARTQVLISTLLVSSYRPGWTTFQGGMDMQVIWDDQEPLDFLESVGLEELPFSGQADWSKASYRLEVDELKSEDSDLTLHMQEAELAGSYHYNGEQDGQLQMERLAFTSPRADDLEILDLEAVWQNTGGYPWGEGEMQVHATEITYQSPLGRVQLQQPQLDYAIQLTEEALDLSMQLDTGEITSSGRPLGQVDITFHTENLNGEAALELAEHFNQDIDWNQADAAAMQPARDAASRLLSGSPKLVLDQLAVELQAPFPIQQMAEGELKFDGRNLPTDYLARLSAGELPPEDFASRVSLQLLMDEVDPNLMRLVGLPTSLLDEEADQQMLSWEKGQLRLNDQPLPF
ncbi:DUF945 family protein [Marinospirillum perlucidum]|uniref:DUF945 family protein n=1 Tax=Marinospirillum perlucidum TaxID=1982602 RepID=UPI000DF449EF|nr:DUF945 family protein [Marinospirillum perlucidum]